MNSQTGLFNKQTPALTYLNKQKKMFQTYFKKIKYIIKNIVSKQPDSLYIPWINLFVALCHTESFQNKHKILMIFCQGRKGSKLE